MSPLSRRDLADFVYRHESLIRQAAARRLHPGARGVADSEDILQTVLMRLDQLAARGRLDFESEHKIVSLAVVIAQNRATDRTRMVQLARKHASQDGEFARLILRRLEANEEEDATILLLEMLTTLERPDDRLYLSLRARGTAHQAIAQALGISHDAGRKRWESIRRRLAEVFAGELSDG